MAAFALQPNYFVSLVMFRHVQEAFRANDAESGPTSLPRRTLPGHAKQIGGMRSHKDAGVAGKI